MSSSSTGWTDALKDVWLIEIAIVHVGADIVSVARSRLSLADDDNGEPSW